MAKVGSIRKKGKRYELRVYINGVQKSFSGATEAEVRKKHREYMKQLSNSQVTQTGIQANKIIGDPKLLGNVGDSIKYWLENYKFGYVQDTTYDRVESVYRNHVQGSPIADKQVMEVTYDDVRRLLEQKKSTLSDSSLRKLRALFSEFYSLLLDLKLIESNPIITLKVPRSTKKKDIIASADRECVKPDKIYSDADVRKLLTIVDTRLHPATQKRYRYAPMFLFILNTGLRLGECIALTWDMVDFEKKIMYVKENVKVVQNRGRYEGMGNKVQVVGRTKTKDSKRVVPLNDSAISLLHEMQSRNDLRNIQSKYCFPSYEGKELNIRAVQQTFTKICTDVGVNSLGIHALRHTFASKILREGVDIKTVSEILGHSNAMFTYKAYIHIIQEQKASAMQLIDFTQV